MTKVHLELSLPDDVAAEARQAGLLEPTAVASLLHRQLQLTKFDERMERVKNTPGEPMSAEEIQAEINAYRREKRTARAHRR